MIFQKPVQTCRQVDLKHEGRKIKKRRKITFSQTSLCRTFIHIFYQLGVTIYSKPRTEKVELSPCVSFCISEYGHISLTFLSSE